MLDGCQPAHNTLVCNATYWMDSSGQSRTDSSFLLFYVRDSTTPPNTEHLGIVHCRGYQRIIEGLEKNLVTPKTSLHQVEAPLDCSCM